MSECTSNAQACYSCLPTSTATELLYRVLLDKQTTECKIRYAVSVLRFVDSKTTNVVIARQFYKPDVNAWLPARGAICLPVEAWCALTANVELISQIDQAIKSELGTKQP